MKPLKALPLLLMLVFALPATQAKPKKPYKLPAAFNQARYVYVEAEDGQVYDPRLDPYDRQAIGDVDDALYKWKRYAVTTRREDADLIFVVRKGRLAAAKAGVQVGSGGPQAYPNPQGNPGPRTAPGNGIALGGEVGPPDDLLEVYERSPDNSRGATLWQRSFADGLNPPDLTLLKQLKDAVERDYPVQTANQSKP